MLSEVLLLLSPCNYHHPQNIKHSHHVVQYFTFHLNCILINHQRDLEIVMKLAKGYQPPLISE